MNIPPKKHKNTIEIIIDITCEVFANIAYFFKNHLVSIANLNILLSPYIMYFVGQNAAIKAGKLHIGIVIIIPIFLAIISFYLKSIANKIGKGVDVPLPDRRFTQVDDDGEVSVEQTRLQELLLYTADLEDWLERKGLM